MIQRASHFIAWAGDKNVISLLNICTGITLFSPSEIQERGK